MTYSQALLIDAAYAAGAKAPTAEQAERLAADVAAGRAIGADEHEQMNALERACETDA